jgi:hypothetical protein
MKLYRMMNDDCRLTNCGCRFALLFLTYKIDRIHSFDIRHSTFCGSSVRCSVVPSFDIRYSIFCGSTVLFSVYSFLRHLSAGGGFDIYHSIFEILFLYLKVHLHAKPVLRRSRRADRAYSGRSCSLIDPDFAGVVALAVPVALAGGAFLDSDFIDFLSDVEFSWMPSIFF